VPAAEAADMPTERFGRMNGWMDQCDVEHDNMKLGFALNDRHRLFIYLL